MQYRLLWGYANGGGSVWWFVGLAVGGTFALGSSAFTEVWRHILLALACIACVGAPYVGLLLTRAARNHWEVLKRKRAAKLRGPSYADYAYIL